MILPYYRERRHCELATRGMTTLYRLLPASPFSFKMDGVGYFYFDEAIYYIVLYLLHY